MSNVFHVLIIERIRSYIPSGNLTYRFSLADIRRRSEKTHKLELSSAVLCRNPREAMGNMLRFLYSVGERDKTHGFGGRILFAMPEQENIIL